MSLLSVIVVMIVGLASVMSDEMDRDDPPSNLDGSMLSLFSSDKRIYWEFVMLELVEKCYGALDQFEDVHDC